MTAIPRRILLTVTLAALVIAGAVSWIADPVADYNENHQSANVSESAYEQPVPEEGDQYFEGVAPDGSWISYVNPRDEYRDPTLGETSGKICVTLLNEQGDAIVGESVPNTTVAIPTGEAIEWHSETPVQVQFPLSEHYDRPLDADQFGTNPDLPQGDGYLDTHCVEFNGLRNNETVEYGRASITGAHADRIDVVGYIQQPQQEWDSSVDPIAEADPYEVAGGGWTHAPNATHGQVVVVLQLDPSENASNAVMATADGKVTTNSATVRPSWQVTDGDTSTDGQVPKSDSLEGTTEADPSQSVLSGLVVSAPILHPSSRISAGGVA